MAQADSCHFIRTHSDTQWLTMTHYDWQWPTMAHYDPLVLTMTYDSSCCHNWLTLCTHEESLWIMITHDDSIWLTSPWLMLTHPDLCWITHFHVLLISIAHIPTFCPWKPKFLTSECPYNRFYLCTLKIFYIAISYTLTLTRPGLGSWV